MCVKRLLKLFQRRKRPKLTDEELAENLYGKKRPPRKWWEFPFRVVSTKRPGPNMPKHQPCPRCHAGSKRREKTVGGAFYACQNHGRFFVRGSRAQIPR